MSDECLCLWEYGPAESPHSDYCPLAKDKIIAALEAKLALMEECLLGIAGGDFSNTALAARRALSELKHQPIRHRR